MQFDPANKMQREFLDAIALGETAHRNDAYILGVGTISVASYPRNKYGFPIWPGLKNSHAAGRYQFEPSTWARIAERYSLNFSNPRDQDAGAWYLAESDYHARSGEQLVSALKRGAFDQVQKCLFATWPSVNGNGASPHGLAHLLAVACNAGW